jgi:flagellar basal body-associated protein FliL
LGAFAIAPLSDEIIMAEEAKKPEKKAEAPAPAAEKKGEHKEKEKGGGLLTKMPVLLGGAMIIEAVVLFAGFKFLGSGAHPAAAAPTELVTTEQGGEGHAEAGEGKEGEAKPAHKGKTVEVDVLFPDPKAPGSFKAPNKMTGRTYLYDVKIKAIVKTEFEERVKESLSDNEGLIKDRIRTIIAQSDPEKLGGAKEPGLETLRRQVKHQLDDIVGDGMIEEVIVPSCIGFRAD